MPLIAGAVAQAGQERLRTPQDACSGRWVFDLPYVVTGGGPASSTETMSTYAYNILFSGLELGYGSMIATAMFVTELVIAGVFGLFIVRRLRQEA